MLKERVPLCLYKDNIVVPSEERLPNGCLPGRLVKTGWSADSMQRRPWPVGESTVFLDTKDVPDTLRYLLDRFIKPAQVTRGAYAGREGCRRQRRGSCAPRLTEVADYVPRDGDFLHTHTGIVGSYKRPPATQLFKRASVCTGTKAAPQKRWSRGIP